MIKYAVEWEDNREDFGDSNSAMLFADKTALKDIVNVKITREIDGVLEDEPFYSATWEA